MKILLCHNFYQQPGGEDECFRQEGELLQTHGHAVLRYTRHNDDVQKMSSLGVARQTLFSPRTYREVRELIHRERPDVVHCTNTFPLISPAVYNAAYDEKVPVVQALHNYRLLCPGALLLRDGNVCESCLGKSFPWPAIQHGCYRDNRLASGVVALMLAVHHWRKTWQKRVTLYYALTEFGRRKFIEGGLPADRMLVKPNFITPDPQPASEQGYVAFVGRLSQEKGIRTLLDAWSKLQTPVPLKIAGDGPLREMVAAAAEADSRITWLGRVSPAAAVEFVGNASCMILPSLWYEGFPRTIIEAFSRGTPVIASQLGSMEEVIDHGRTGFHIEPGNPDDICSPLHRRDKLRIADRHLLGGDTARRRRLAKRSCPNHQPSAQTAGPHVGFGRGAADSRFLRLPTFDVQPCSRLPIFQSTFRKNTMCSGFRSAQRHTKRRSPR